MEAETEAILKKVAQTKNTVVAGKLVEKEVNFLSQQSVQALKNEKEQIAETLKQPEWARHDITARQVEELNERQSNIDAQLEDVAPPKVSGQAKDALNVRRQELEDKIRIGMVTEEEMRRNPTGSVYKHMKWEKENIFNILEWKNIKKVLEPDSEDPELCSVELLRPSMLPQSGSTFMPDAQIPGHFAMTAKAKENFDKVFPDSPTANTALKQLGRFEDDRVGKVEAELKQVKHDLEIKLRQARKLAYMASKKEETDINPQIPTV